MISSEVQRTLVKSPPELWAEISDPTSLARHLGEFGEIRITRVEPEQRVEWEAGDTSGSVVIKPSGWGTKVKLTVTRELPQPDVDAFADSPDDSADGEADADASELAKTADGDGGEAELQDAAQPDPEELVEPKAGASNDADGGFADDLDAASEQEAAPLTAPERRRGFFARLFGRRRAARADAGRRARRVRASRAGRPRTRALQRVDGVGGTGRRGRP